MTVLLETARLIVRNWHGGDAEAFYRLNSDESVMLFFPFRRDRIQSEELREKLAAAIASAGFGFAALEEKASGACIGFCGLSPTGLPAPFPDDEIEIGWRLLPQYWGRGFATEAARAWLRHGFEVLRLPQIVSFAVASNERSLAVMRRLGLTPVPERDFDHPRVPETHPHLRRHAFYALDRQTWHARQ